MATVTFRAVSKSFGGTPVIERLDLAVRDREFMVLVGPSGCGKSTALRMLAGLEDPSGGEIEIGERVVNDVPPKDRDIAMVFQNYALYPHMTVRENLDFGLRMRGMARPERDRLVDEASDILGISALLDRRPGQLSGGQRQRVALGRAIVRKPAVFLFDEPLSNLDAKLRGQMRAEIKKLQNRLKTTTVYVTHDQVEAMTMGTRIAVMKDGKIQQIGEPLEIYDRPGNLFVAGFVGTPPMNLLPATVAPGGELRGAGFSFAPPAELRGSPALREGAAVIVGIRPENFKRIASGSGIEPRLSLVAEVVEPLGDEVVVHARLVDAGVNARLDGATRKQLNDATIILKLGPRDGPAMGESFEATVDLDRLHVFDAGSQARLEGQPT
ncbi:MAG: sn-glycerol-3-phosphate ABC transporter ATP-binding protein UgpC [Acidobacteriota bacterium]|nr:sn-glycerol-3-phosphate ABC transporter ATP-binding protein UgpC [Acidobacteriota bacterium]